MVALNNVMEPSNVICSDGISRDISPPQILNITLEHAKWSYSTYCYDNTTWILRSDLVKIQPSDSDEPGCESNSRSLLVEALPFALDINEYHPISDMIELSNKTINEMLK